MTSPSVVPSPKPAPPYATRALLGHSVDNRPLLLHIFGHGEPTILIIGGIHGDEPTGASVAEELVALLRSQPDLVGHRRVAILPVANPDGLAAKSRYNANGVDLNRNFPARSWQAGRGRRARNGTAPASEPETRAILNAFERLRPDRVISLHSIRRGRHGNNYDGPAGDLAALMAASNGYPVLPTMGYPTPGSLGSWAGVDGGVPVVTLELPRDAGDEECWHENRAALLAFVQADRERSGATLAK